MGSLRTLIEILSRHLAHAERLLIYGVLLAGAVIFSFPFVWMVGTSFKINREMASEKLRVWPSPPRPHRRTPYIDADEFGAPERPDGVPEAVWNSVLPRWREMVRQRLAPWEPSALAEDEPVGGEHLDRAVYNLEMSEGMIQLLGDRIADEARGKAFAVQKGLGGGELSEEAIRAGADAIVAAAAEQLSEEALEEVFDRCYRRFCLGTCRLRTSDYRMHVFGDGDHWKAEKGESVLVRRTAGPLRIAEGRIDYGDDGRAVSFTMQRALECSPDAIDRVYVSYRGDAAWSRITFEVSRGGRLFRTREVANLSDRDWIETELRWPGGGGDSMAAQTYLFLRDAGPAAAGGAPFSVRLTLQPSGTIGAWRDKIMNHYRRVFREFPFVRYIMTSLALSILSIVLTVFSCTLVAYAFARLQWPGRDLCFGIMLATMMIPPQVTMIPSFLIHRHLGWYNTLLPLWVGAAFGAPFFIFLLRQFLKTVPQDLEDAARIDGCGFLRIYWHVMLPLVRPTIAIVAIYTFMGVWNNFMGPLIYINDERLFPLALGLFKFNLRSGSEVGLMMAASFIMTLPIVALFFFVQRYFIQGITLTGMKG